MERTYNDDIDQLRTTEYPLLNGSQPSAATPVDNVWTDFALDMTYLDHGGTTPYPQSLIQRFSQDLTSNLFGNPHSASPSSALSTRRIDHVRASVLEFFQADPLHFDVVFVANATAAIKLVADAFRDADESGFWYGYHGDAHTSLVGIRELATESRCFESDSEVEKWLNDKGLDSSHGDSLAKTGLFAYPAQSNLNGHRLPLDWAGKVRGGRQCADGRKIYTLLDAAAFAMTAPLDLSDALSAPDFTALSFYKIFGFPDLGALIVRKTASDVLRKRRYFGGGTVDMVTSLQIPWHAKKEQTVHDQLEDGTLPFHSIVALDTALQVHTELYGSMVNISRHTCALAHALYDQLRRLRHANGRVVCEIYKDPNSQYGNPKTQGPTIAFNLRNAQGGWIKKTDVESLAIIRGIHLRTGGVCNPGGIATFCQLSYSDMRKNFSEGMRCGDTLDILGGKPTGVVRVSLGAMSTWKDVQTFVDFVQELFVETKSMVKLAHISPPNSSRGEISTVESLRIFPIMGCSGRKVPNHISWPIGATGLAWDREWCVVRQDDGQLLDTETCQRMTLIKPYLDIENGILKIISTTDANEITIPIWETPSNADQLVQTGPPVDLYNSKAVINFFTSVIGIPCTLARFQDSRRNPKKRAHTTPASDRKNDSKLHCYRRPTMAIGASGEPFANIMAAGLPDLLHTSHIRIAHQYFELIPQERLSSPSSISFFTPMSSNIYPLRPLHNPYDNSVSGQNPTLHAGDPVQAFSTSSKDGTNLPLDLRACLTFADAGDYVCPVVRCWKIFPTAEELSQHFHAHASSPPLSSEQKANNKINDSTLEIAAFQGKGKWTGERWWTKPREPSSKKRWKTRLFPAKLGAVAA